MTLIADLLDQIFQVNRLALLEGKDVGYLVHQRVKHARLLLVLLLLEDGLRLLFIFSFNLILDLDGSQIVG